MGVEQFGFTCPSSSSSPCLQYTDETPLLDSAGLGMGSNQPTEAVMRCLDSWSARHQRR